MRALTLLIPGLSWPHDDAAAVYRHLEAPWLARCLGRSQLQPASRSRAEYYQTWFGVSDVPEVALSAHYDGLSVRTAIICGPIPCMFRSPKRECGWWGRMC